MRVRVILSAGVVLVAAVSLVMATTASASNSKGGRPTNVVIVDPFLSNGKLKPRLRVVQAVRGSCFTGSIADQSRPGAWRCSAGNAILDPCIATAQSGRRLACFSAPWDNRIVLLRLTRALPLGQGNTDQSPEGNPWGVELASRERCTLETGAEGIVSGRPITYNCEHRGIIVGDIDQRRPIWRAWFKREVDSGRLVRVHVKIAWY